jgi:hypothetical protein
MAMAAVLCSAVSACSAAVASPRRGTRGGGGRGVASSMHHLKLLHRLSNFSSRFAFFPCMKPGCVTFRTRGNERIFFTSGNTSVVVDSGSKRRARGPLMAAKKAAEGSVQEGGQYKDTVDLPQTSFNMKANAVQREPEIQKLWEDKQILQKLLERNTGV